MMFRKLYWVTEQLESDGRSRVTGVYTSIPDLIRHGLRCDAMDRMRLTLTKLDSCNEPIGCWTPRDFASIGDRLQEFVRTDEFSAEHCQALVQALSTQTLVAA
jgi:hypothetical protein